MPASVRTWRLRHTGAMRSHGHFADVACQVPHSGAPPPLQQPRVRRMLSTGCPWRASSRRSTCAQLACAMRRCGASRHVGTTWAVRTNFGAYDGRKVRAGRAEPACAKCGDNVELNRTTQSGVTLAINEREGRAAAVRTAAAVVHPRSRVHNSCCNAHSRRDATRSRCSRVLAQLALPCPQSIGDPGAPPAC